MEWKITIFFILQMPSVSSTYVLIFNTIWGQQDLILYFIFWQFFSYLDPFHKKTPTNMMIQTMKWQDKSSVLQPYIPKWIPNIFIYPKLSPHHCFRHSLLTKFNKRPFHLLTFTIEVNTAFKYVLMYPALSFVIDRTLIDSWSNQKKPKNIKTKIKKI